MQIKPLQTYLYLTYTTNTANFFQQYEALTINLLNVATPQSIGWDSAFTNYLPVAGISLIGNANIKLQYAQIETDGDFSANSNVVHGSVGSMISYSPSGNLWEGPYDGSNLNDGDIGDGVVSDGTYAITEAGPGSLILSFDGSKTLSSIAIYNGYTNRDDGSYTLKDGAGNVLGAWTISGSAGSTNENANSFWLNFNTPVTTDKLVIDSTSTDGITNSYREIQIFGPSADSVTGLVVEQSQPTNDVLTSGGIISFTDPDLSDVHSVSATPIGTPWGNLTVLKNSDTTGTGVGGQLTWSYTVDNSTIMSLGAGETKIESFNIAVDDLHGGLATKMVDITILGV